MQGQGGEHERHDGLAGDAEGQRGDHRAARDRVVGGFGGDEAVGFALPEVFPILGKALGGRVADEGGRRRAGAGEDAEAHADER